MQSSKPSRQKEMLIATMALLISIVVPFAIEGYVPSLPAMTNYFHSTPTLMQLSITLFLLGAALAQLIYGPLSDRFGRRRVVLGGLSIGIVGGVFCALAPTPDLLILARFIQGAGIGASNALYRAIMRDTFSGKNMAKILSYTSIAFTGALALAPVLGGYIQHYLGWRMNFVFLILLTAAIVITVWRFFPETNLNLNPTATKIKNIGLTYLTLIKSPIFIGYSLCSGLGLAGFFIYYSVSPFLLQDVIGISAVAYGWLSVLFAISLTLGQFLNAKLVMRFGYQRLLIVGLLSMTVGGVIMLIFGLCGILNITVIVLPAMVFVISSGLVFSNAMTGALEPFASVAGFAGALYGCMQMMTGFVTTFIVAALHVNNQNIVAAAFVLLGLAGLGAYRFSQVGQVIK